MKMKIACAAVAACWAFGSVAEAKESRDTFTVLTWNTEHYGRKFSCFPSDHAALLVTYEIVPAEQFERTADK